MQPYTVSIYAMYECMQFATYRMPNYPQLQYLSFCHAPQMISTCCLHIFVLSTVGTVALLPWTHIQQYYACYVCMCLRMHNICVSACVMFRKCRVTAMYGQYQLSPSSCKMPKINWYYNNFFNAYTISNLNIFITDINVYHTVHSSCQYAVQTAVLIILQLLVCYCASMVEMKLSSVQFGCLKKHMPVSKAYIQPHHQLLKLVKACKYWLSTQLKIPKASNFNILPIFC